MIGITAAQPQGFFLCALLGMGAGILYSLLVPLLRHIRHKWAVHVLEGIFCLMMGPVFYTGLYFASYGAPRLFCFLGFGLGFAIAYVGPGYYIIKGLTAVISRMEAWNRADETKEQ